MKNILILISILVYFLSSSACSTTYIYSTLNSANASVEKTNEGDFFFENDSLWISYSLKALNQTSRGANAQLVISIFNKLDKPLFIDWNKSFLSYNGIRHSYKGVVDLVGIGDGYGGAYEYDVSVVKNQNHMEEVSKAGNYVSVIDPRMMISYGTFDLTEDLGKYRKAKMDNLELKTEQGASKKVQGWVFDSSNTPLQLASYIKTYYHKPDEGQTYGINLYMANILRTQTKPEKMPQDMSERGDVLLYKRKASNRFWKSLGKGAAISGIAITTIAVDSYLNKDED